MTSRKALAESLKKFEHLPKIPNTIKKQDPSENSRTLLTDLARLHPSRHLCVFPQSIFSFKFHVCAIRMAFEHFFKLQLPYLQGVLEVALVISDTYFSDLVAASRKGLKDDDNINNESLNLDCITKDDERMIQELIDANEELFTKFKNCMINVIVEKYIPLFTNDFEEYAKLFRTFDFMMRKHFKWCSPCEEMPSLSIYMPEVLTFFARAVSSVEASAKLFNLIVNGDSTIIFGILGVYLKRIDMWKHTRQSPDKNDGSKYLIDHVDDKDIAKILKMQELFVKCQNGTDGSPKTGVKQSLFAAAVIGVAVLAIGASYWRKNSNNE